MTAPIMATKNGTAASGMNYDQVYRLTTHGSNRLGGNATADVLTFGRIAAKTASISNTPFVRAILLPPRH